ncbi:MAG: hypothetical protein IRY94_11690, partial [Rhodospirillaceae bacterium]|nr:hypothetical protein [Rhodospirillaceae bacterium]
MRRSRRHRRRGRAPLALGLLLPALAACGFEPLYGERADGTGVGDQMAQVYVMPISDRVGQILYNDLRDRIVPHGQPADPKYVLVVRVGQSYSSAVVRPDATASRVNLTMRAIYTLHDARSRAVLTRGVAESVGAYSVRVEPYPTLVARQDVQTRVARDLSDEIRNRLAAYFASPAPAPPPPPEL